MSPKGQYVRDFSRFSVAVRDNDTDHAWVEISDFPGYFVCREGLVLNLYGRVAKPGINTSGYQMVGLRRDGKSHTRMIHRLVAEAFVPKPEGLSEVNHKNGVKSDNRAENLEWVTRAENCQHALANGLARSGERAWNRKLTEDQVREIRALKGCGRSQYEIADEYGVSQMTVNRIMLGTKWKYVA